MAAETRRDIVVPARQRLVWRVLVDALASLTPPVEAASVLDCGGGSGSFAVPLASAGAAVTVVDSSADALATLRRRAAEAEVADRVHPVQADVESLTDAVAGATFDLVLAHGILEAVEDVASAFAAITSAARPGGLVSLLVSNPVAAVLARALAGDLPAALAELRALEANALATPRGVAQLCAAAGLVVEQTHGVGVFTELVPGAALDVPGAAEALADLETETAARAPFADMASRVHVLARRPG